MTTEELFLSLRDIQPPPAPPWWQIAPIWWLLLVVTVLAILLAMIWHKRRQEHRLIKLAHHELENIIGQYDNNLEKRALLMALAGWLKRVAIVAYPQQRLESLNGNAWLAFLDQCLGGDRFRHGPGQIFGGDIYREQIDYDVIPVIETCQCWMSAVSPALHRQGRG